MPESRDTQRTHEPDLREITAELDGVRNEIAIRIENWREFLEERDKRYNERSKAQETAVTKAFEASEKAADRTSGLQKEYEIRANEWRNALKDAQDRYAERTNVDTRFNEVKNLIDRNLDSLTKSIDELKHSRDTTEGRSSGISSSIALVIALAGMALTVVLFLLKSK